MSYQNKFKYIIITLIIFIPIIVSINYFLNIKIDSIIKSKLITISENTNKLLKQSIDDKAYATLNIALALSEYSATNDVFKKDSNTYKNLKNISLKIKEKSNFKNVWIHLVDKEGYSRFRSWTNKRNDNILNKRKELVPLLKNPKIKSVISVGIFDLTFKSIIPVYKDNVFQGFIEVITKFNSIAEKFKKEQIDLIILVDKKYKKQIKKPFTKNFIDEYYVANLNARKELLKLTKNTPTKFLDIKNYQIKNNKFITTYILKDFKNENMAYIISFQNYNEIFLKEIKDLKSFIHVISFLFILIAISIFISYYFFSKSRYTNTLKKEVAARTKQLNQITKRYKQIFEGSHAIKLIVDPVTKQIIDANNAALKFYGYTFEEIKKLKSYDINVDIDDKSKVFSQVLNEEKNYFVFKHKLSNGELKDVEVYSSAVDINEKKYIYSIIIDITEEMKLKKEYEEKQKLFYKQAKMASMGEMLENIAHQWRQPLSTITTAASGINLKKELGLLDDNFLDESTGIIIKSANYLSSTIEDFRNFFKHSQTIEKFKISQALKECTSILKLKLHSNEILVKHLYKDDIEIEGYKNELTQVFLNLLNNSIFALKSNNIEKKLVIITIKKDKKDILISIQDNANGIDKEIIDKVFEPYFTTKHQSQGTGIGLYMSEQIITKHYMGEINIDNCEFVYENNTYYGAKATIRIPIKNI